MKYLIMTLVIATALSLGACSSPTPTVPAASQAPIQVSDAWVRSASMSLGNMGNMNMGSSSSSNMSMGMSSSSGMNMGASSSSGMNMNQSTTAVYMVLRNSSTTADRLVKVQTDAAQTVELHSTTMQGNVTMMNPVDGIDVPANGQVALAPGGFHIMLIGLTRDLKSGDKIKLTLTFQKAGTVQLDVPVRDQ